MSTGTGAGVRVPGLVRAPGAPGGAGQLGPGDGIDRGRRRPVDAFLRAACLTFSEPQHAGRALTMLADDPGLATASAATMAACGAADDLANLLARDPAAVDRLDGPHRWPSLLYLCYARLGRGDSVATAKVLLEAGADPNAGFLWQWLPSPFTAVTGVLGGGERDEPPHHDGVALATLLLDTGADPNDNQALYNRQFRADDSHLGPLLEHGVGQPQPSPWRDRLGSAYPSPAEMLGEHLRKAAAAGFMNGSGGCSRTASILARAATIPPSATRRRTRSRSATATSTPPICWRPPARPATAWTRSIGCWRQPSVATKRRCSDWRPTRRRW